MRIAVIAPPWLPVPPPAYGGTEAVVDSLARGLSAAGHDVLLIGHPDSTSPVQRRSIVPAEDTARMGRASIELEHAIGAYRLAEGYDIVSDHTVGGPVCAALAPSLAVVATNHNPFTRQANAIYSANLAQVDVVAISHAHADSTSVPIAAVIHHGLDATRFPIGDGAGGYLAMATRMAPDKGVHRAVAVAGRAGVELRIAAKMREEREIAYFDEHVRPHLGRGVEYLGELETAAVHELLGGALALLNPIQWNEPFGMAMVESLACGTPVVACPQGAAPEIVRDGVNGFLAESDDDLVTAVGAVGGIDRAACRRWVEEHFSVEQMTAGYVAAYQTRAAR